MAKSDVKEIAPGKVTDKGKRAFTPADEAQITDTIHNEWTRRKKIAKRVSREKIWDEVDRQLEMRPDKAWKQDPEGRDVPANAWMPEAELPLQAQTLEVLTADAKRMILPPDGSPFFSSAALMSDEYLARVDFTQTIAGSENDPGSAVSQNEANAYVTGLLHHFHDQTDFDGIVDALLAEGYKYGMVVARAVVTEKDVFLDTARGTMKQKQKLPRLVPFSIRNTYPDDSCYNLFKNGYEISPATIFQEERSYHDVQLAASKGSSDPDDMEGGWISRNVKKLGLANVKNPGAINVVEYEGDLVVNRKTTTSLFLPNCIATIAVTEGAKSLIRLRFSPFPFTTFITQPYHIEGATDIYGTSPLMKGMPVQKLAVDALNRAHIAMAFSAQPPIKYDENDLHFAGGGGPELCPGVAIPNADVEAIDVWDAGPIMQGYLVHLQHYSDVTGVNAPRLGAQTNSHTTAFAKDVENSRGQARTVDFVTTMLRSFFKKWLHMEYAMAMKVLTKPITYYLPMAGYQGWVEVTRSQLPDEATFKVLGAGGPQDEVAKEQREDATIQAVVQIEVAELQRAAQGGPEPTEFLDLSAMKRERLRNAFTDTDEFLKPVAPANQGQPPGANAASGAVSPGVVTADPAFGA